MGFNTLHTAATGLTAAQRAMDVMSQNVVNQNTPGYSRQQIRTASVSAPSQNSMHSGMAPMTGGVTVTDVVRIRDAFVESTRAAAGSRLAALAAQSDSLSGAQKLLIAPSDTGLQPALDDFFAGWQALALHPADAASARVVLQKGAALTEQLNSVADGVNAEWSSTRSTLEQTIAEANLTATSLAKVNQNIAFATNTGNNANELLDERDQLVRRLGELVGATSTPGPDNTASVTVNGYNIVGRDYSTPLTISGASTLSGVSGSPITIMWGAYAVTVTGGAAAGQVAALNSDLTSVASQLDAVAVALHDSVNTLHTAGFTIAGAAGANFFSYSGVPSALNLRVALTDPTTLAVSSGATVTNGVTAQKIGDLAHDATAATLLGGPGASVRYRNLVASVGATVSTLDTSISVQNSVVNAAEDAAQSDSGVNIDEEMTNMLLWQRSYEASARVFTAVDEMLDTLVNRTGTVGR